MGDRLPSRLHPSEALQGYSCQREIPTGSALEESKVLIMGDIRLHVTESEAALQPVTGRYSIEITGMQGPLHLLWHAEGQVLSRQTPSTDIVFDARGARAGERRTYLVAVQVTERGIRGRVVQSGVFVQIVVVGDKLPDTSL